MKKLLFTSVFCLITLFLFSQPNMTIWKLDSEHHDHSHEDPIDPPEQYDCGNYFFFYSADPIVSNWSLKNEGNEDLIIELPLELSIPYQDRITIIQQPESNLVPPGEEVFFQVQYSDIGIHQNVFLPFYSNDEMMNGCGLLMGGNILATCQCQCNGSSMQESVNCMRMTTTATIQLTISNGPCPMEGGDCAPISISDPCGCDNTIEFDGQFLFRDTLVIEALAGTPINIVQNNMDGMVDEMNMPLMNGLAIGNIPPSGILKFPFFRRPGTIVDISVNGTPFISDMACPEEAACLVPIPTITEWGKMILLLSLTILGFLVYRSLKFSNRFIGTDSLIK